MYNQLRQKLNKFYKGGEIPKFEEPATPLEYLVPSTPGLSIDDIVINGVNTDIESAASVVGETASEKLTSTIKATSAQDFAKMQTMVNNQNAAKGAKSFFGALSGINEKSSAIGSNPGQMSMDAAIGTGIVTNAAVGAMKAIDKAAMGDKNFGAQSEAIDSAVHGVSGTLMKSGNPYCVCKGTKILLSDGTLKNIEDITLQDEVLGYTRIQQYVENWHLNMAIHYYNAYILPRLNELKIEQN